MDVIIRRKPVSIPILPFLAILLIAGLAFLTMRVGRVQANQIGVLVDNLSGEIQLRDAGAWVYNGLISEFYLLDNTVQTIRMVGTDDQVNIKSADGADVSLDVEVNYRLIQDRSILANTVVPECGVDKRLEYFRTSDSRGRPRTREVDSYKVKWIRDYSRTVIRYIFGKLKTGEFYDAKLRDNRAREAETELNSLLQPHGLEVLTVVPLDVRFYADYEQIIADKKAANQEVESQRELAKKAFEEQKKRETEATARANVQIAERKGELKVELVRAEADAIAAVTEAEAYAIEIKKGADATLYQVRNQAKSVLAKHTAEAKGLQQLAAALSGPGGANLVKIEYAKALQQAHIKGVPYATDPRIQKVEISGETLRNGEGK